MGSILGSLSFLNPWALAGLLILPALYLLLKIMPPAPRVIVFPPARFLKNLEHHNTTPHRTPWWILLLRLILCALLLLALAHPVLNPAAPLTQTGPLRLVIDNDWASAQNWDSLMQEAEEALTQSARVGQTVTLLTTAPEAQDPEKRQEIPVTLSTLKGLKPLPWESDLSRLNPAPAFKGTTIWLSHGLQQEGQDALARKLAQIGPVILKKPEDNALPLFLIPPTHKPKDPAIQIDGPRDMVWKTPIIVQVLGPKGQVIDEETIFATGRPFPLEVTFSLPEPLRRTITGFRLPQIRGAQSLYLMVDDGGPKTIGILADTPQNTQEALTNDVFYLKKALEPLGSLKIGSLDTIMTQNLDGIILPDIAAMPMQDLTRLESWVQKGGLLLRFAGPHMTQNTGNIPLTPLPLRTQSRTMEGALSWEKPLKLAPFETASPFYGLPIPPDVTVRGQILPEPSPDLKERTWASLSDGTPLVTAAPHGAGRLVMIHTTAAPTWTTLPLSGLYIDILKRIIETSGQQMTESTTQNGTYQPLRLLDGFGQFQPPSGLVTPIHSAQFDTIRPSPRHPPGFYGQDTIRKMFNLGPTLKETYRLQNLENATIQGFSSTKERDLTPLLFTGAFLLFLLDTLVMLGLSWPSNRILKRFLGVLFLAFLCGTLPAQAQSSDRFAKALTLAYIKTGDAALDTQSQKGLETLAAFLRSRTAAEPQGVTGVDPAQDTLVFFPLIYWPISAAQAPLPAKAIQNLQSYLDHGGTLLIDTRDGGLSQNTENGPLRRAMTGLNIPPLIQIPQNHVLGKTFYLLNDFPGRQRGAPLWVERQSLNGRDGVSSVILGGNDWAGAWADTTVQTLGGRTYITGGSPEQAAQQEQALRTGINIMMYALTGHYKADQVHLPALLERMGR